MPEIETVRERDIRAADARAADGRRGPGIGTYVASVAVVGLGAALIESELLAGMALGVAAIAFPSLVPKLGNAFRPMLKSALRAGYGAASRTRATMAEMSEQFQDVVAEVRAERDGAEGEEMAGGEEPTMESHENGGARGESGEREHGRGRRGRSHSSAGPAEQHS